MHTAVCAYCAFRRDAVCMPTVYRPRLLLPIMVYLVVSHLLCEIYAFPLRDDAIFRLFKRTLVFSGARRARIWGVWDLARWKNDRTFYLYYCTLLGRNMSTEPVSVLYARYWCVLYDIIVVQKTWKQGSLMYTSADFLVILILMSDKVLSGLAEKPFSLRNPNVPFHFVWYMAAGNVLDCISPQRCDMLCVVVYRSIARMAPHNYTHKIRKWGYMVGKRYRCIPIVVYGGGCARHLIRHVRFGVLPNRGFTLCRHLAR